VYSAGYLDEEDVRTLHAEGVVGDVCTVFLRADGSYQDVALNARATGPTPAELHRVPRRICVVAGDNKVVPLLAALRSGVVTDLVVDEVTATGLLSFAPARDAAGGRVTALRGTPIRGRLGWPGDVQ
jgi:DNA-binding transcriptional regulator LsrR (DeoR family)